ncbi:MAG TPA: ThiF family adenylyltransferase [Candidatus Micrarchaeota archaeon]|nr:ThiF family adenylyltransferase [Candidatus Micrarchaeota archaeon]
MAAKWADMALDCLDNPHSRLALHEACEKAGTPCVFGSASGAYGMAAVFKKTGFRKVFSRLFPLDAGQAKPCAAEGWKCASVIATAPNIIGLVQAQLALSLVLKKPVPQAPNFLVFDGFSARLFRHARL